MFGSKRFLSPPSRRRGLKIYEGKGMVDEITSPPSRRRGLKNVMPDLPATDISRLLRGGVD